MAIRVLPTKTSSGNSNARLRARHSQLFGETGNSSVGVVLSSPNGVAERYDLLNFPGYRRAGDAASR